MVWTPTGIVMLSSALQDAKVEAGTSDNADESAAEASLLQLMKILSPIVTTLSGMVADLRLSQWANARS
eukprot:m.152315 g.152315  ORF g.152315 m.152315 type:complete len:69 (+) comp14317_c0_seq5:2783-2989(+)